DLLADRAVKHTACMGEVAEQERDVEHAGFGDEIRKRAGGNDGRLDRADLQPLKNLALATKARGREVAEHEALVGAAFDDLLPLVGGNAVVRRGRQRIANLDLLLGLRAEAEA